MPTDVAIGQRRNDALLRIKRALQGGEIQMPRFVQMNDNMRQLKQIEFLADYIETSVASIAAHIPEKYLKAEQLARENANKADIVSVLLEGTDGQ